MHRRARLQPRRASGITWGVQVRASALRQLARPACGLGLALILCLSLRHRFGDGELVGSGSSLRSRAVARENAEPEAEAGAEAGPDEPRAFTLPSGAPPGIGCEDAQRVTGFMRRELVAPAIAPLPRELAAVWSEILDPHGLWSAAPDSPLPSELEAAAPDMLASLHEQLPGCAAAARVARGFEPWLLSLKQIYATAFEAAREAPSLSASEVFRLAAEPIFQDEPVTRPAVELARELGVRLGAFAARFPAETALVDQAEARFFPSGEAALTGLVTLAALRAYVPLVDPHSDFAPLDEEWSLYAGDSTLDAGSALWAEVRRTPLGARVVGDPAPPLELDDLVLSINGLSLAGASIHQIEQAARSAPVQGELKLRVLRQGEPELLSFGVAAEGEPAAGEEGLEVERVAYGDGQIVLAVAIPDVGDWLGEDLAYVLSNDTKDVDAVLFDLRGNGGGSLDAAVEALGLVLPGAPLFPLIHRGAVKEVLEAPRPASPYLGPVAALVDGDTASAAEMLAGGLQAYGRGLVIGAHTFGKGCVQEYFDDVAATGVLRLTTLQFVMPSGKPLQQIGLSPDLTLELAPALERESQITRQPITFDGPDVRDQVSRSGPAWPRPRGVPGPCRDPVLCNALTRLGKAKGGRARGAGSGPRDARQTR